MIDSFNREISYMRLSVTDLCNLRCRYSMPEEGVCKKSHHLMLTEDEMIQAVEVAAGLGIKKLRITGGEPLVKPNILSICERAAQVDGIDKLCLTTNGIMLPKLGKDLKSAGVQNLNISLDTLNPDKYRYITRIGDINDALAGIHTALELGFDKVKVNAVLIGGFNDDEIVDFAKLTRKYPIDVRFIELMPFVQYDESSLGHYISCSTVLEKLPDAEPVEGHGVAREFRLPGAQGNIGLIDSISNRFCSSCNRIRLTADGKLKPCLHSNQEFSIKGLSPDEMRKVMMETILAKPECHTVAAATHSNAGRNMNEIGG